MQMRWGYFIGDFLHRILAGMDLIREENMPRFGRCPGLRAAAYTDEPEEERYSPDREWMPKVVMIAKAPSYGFHSFQKPMEGRLTDWMKFK